MQWCSRKTIQPLQLLQCYLEIGSLWDFVLVTFPRTWAPSNLKYGFSKFGSIKFHLILELKICPMDPRGLVPSRKRITCVFDCAQLSGICAIYKLQQELEKNILSVGYCLMHSTYLMHSTGLQRETVSTGGERGFVKGLICIQSSATHLVEEGLWR